MNKNWIVKEAWHYEHFLQALLEDLASLFKATASCGKKMLDKHERNVGRISSERKKQDDYLKIACFIMFELLCDLLQSWKYFELASFMGCRKDLVEN